MIDPDSCRTVAAGMIVDKVPESIAVKPARETDAADRVHLHSADMHLHKADGLVHREDREIRAGVRAHTVWLTALSGSGKSTSAAGVEHRLFDLRRPVFRLDGDVLRKGLNSDLGFSAADRDENIRRAAEVAKLFNEAGVTVLCAFISPFAAQRDHARRIIGDDRFIEVHVAAPLEVCEARDPHGLYRKVRRGNIPEFTGISSPYEPPHSAELPIRTDDLTEEEAVRQVVDYVLTVQAREQDELDQ